MKFIKTFFLTGLSTLANLIAGFLSSKLLAVFIGPEGLAIAAQFNNFSSLIQTSAGRITQFGVIKHVAEYRTNEYKKRLLLSTAFTLNLVSSLAIGIVIYCSRDYLSLLLFKDTQYSIIITIFSFTLLFFSLGNLLQSIMIGEQAIYKYTIANIFSSIISVLLTYGLAKHYQVIGVLFGYTISQAIVFFFSLILNSRSSWFKLRNFTAGFDMYSFKRLGSHAFMSTLSNFALPIAQIIIRNYIITVASLKSAGYWQGITKISDAYLMIITNVLTTYYLPRLAEINTKTELKKEMHFAYKAILPLVAAMALGIFLMKDFIIELLFTSEFLPMRELFTFQLIGDILKIASWLLSYLLIAKSMAKLFIYAELFFTVCYIVFSAIFIHAYGVLGAPIVFAVNYGIYWLLMLWLTHKQWKAM